MVLFTLDRNFHLVDEIDAFESVLWTERYYGDSEFQLTVEANKSNIQRLARNTKVYLSGSSEVMFIDNLSFKDGLLTVSGKNLMQWMNNRVIRATAAHEDRYWTIVQTPGTILVQIIYFMCIAPAYGDGTAVPTGIPADVMKISTLSVKGYDTSGDNVTIAIPYGPMFDAMKEIAETYNIGQTITLEAITESSYIIQYRNYRGINRTSVATNDPVRFTPQLDSLTDIQEIQSMKDFRNGCYTYAPGNPDGLADTLPRPGIYWTATGRVTPRIGYRGDGPPPFDYTQPILLRDFDVHLMMELEEDITTDQVGGDPGVLQSLLDQRAAKALQNRGVVVAVDGTVVPLNQFQYGRDYNMGDIVEIQGASGVVTSSRVTEYIRAQDSAGERAYPTLAQV